MHQSTYYVLFILLWMLFWPHFTKIGERHVIESHYTQQLNETTLTMGKSTREKHTHMHTQLQPGINAEQAKFDKLDDQLFVAPNYAIKTEFWASPPSPCLATYCQAALQGTCHLPVRQALWERLPTTLNTLSLHSFNFYDLSMSENTHLRQHLLCLVRTYKAYSL